MSILDIFKKKKAKDKKPALKTEKISAGERPGKIVQKQKQLVKTDGPVGPKAAAKEKKPVFGILKKPRITEKASALDGYGQYVFEVYSGANKSQIKKAVESFYNVNVEKVRIIVIPPRPRRLGRTIGTKSGFKKAVVTLRKGEKIELMPH
jgi:large subunit ribosomal protein L23